jgi:hypothetical protein
MQQYIPVIAMLICLAMIFIVTGINKSTSEYRMKSRYQMPKCPDGTEPPCKTGEPSCSGGAVIKDGHCSCPDGRWDKTAGQCTK